MGIMDVATSVWSSWTVIVYILGISGAVTAIMYGIAESKRSSKHIILSLGAVLLLVAIIIWGVSSREYGETEHIALTSAPAPTDRLLRLTDEQGRTVEVLAPTALKQQIERDSERRVYAIQKQLSIWAWSQNPRIKLSEVPEVWAEIKSVNMAPAPEGYQLPPKATEGEE